MSSIFSKIIAGDIKSHCIAENELFYAFLDIMPLTLGHTLIVPKQEVDYIFDLEDATLAAIHVFAKPIATAIKKAYPCPKVGVAVIGLEVPHAHMHLVPIHTADDLNFTRPKLKPTEKQLQASAKLIKSYL